MADEEDPRKDFRKRRNPFFDLFSEFDRMDEMMDQMMRKAFDDMDLAKAKNKPLVYGFSVKVGPDGKPNIQEFGNMQPTQERVQVRNEREPLVDVIDKNSEIDVLAELPGVEKEDIDVKATEDSLTIQVPNKFRKEIALNEKIKKDSVKARYKNGVLTVTVQKKEPKKDSKKVRVE
ncbi:MAG: Hsp20/alpha crystallin family protein [Candidatus Diapherotrites archaeon]|nr:Hsp20/alpha crystallin family protein [Candidatus Diapherotrites archaeon]